MYSHIGNHTGPNCPSPFKGILPMMIDINPTLVAKMERLFSTLEEAHKEMGETEYQSLFYDSQESGDLQSDPVEFTKFRKDTLQLAIDIKKSLRL